MQQFGDHGAWTVASCMTGQSTKLHRHRRRGMQVYDPADTFTKHPRFAQFEACDVAMVSRGLPGLT